MAYDPQFKLRVLKYLASGHTQKETASVFGIGTTTLKSWKKRLATSGNLAPLTRQRQPKKIDPVRLKAYIAAHPDAYLREIADEFSCATSAVHKALKKLKITRKKRR